MITLKVIPIIIVIRFALKHSQKESTTHLHGLM